jgi:hypothetical protein
MNARPDGQEPDPRALPGLLTGDLVPGQKTESRHGRASL